MKPIPVLLLTREFERIFAVFEAERVLLVLIVKRIPIVQVERTVYTYTGRVTPAGEHVYFEADAKEISV